MRTAVAAVVFTAALLAEAFAAGTGPLVPLSDLFGQPDRYFSVVSPDGKWVSWLASMNGVTNLWIAPLNHPENARAVTSDASYGFSLTTGTTWSYDGKDVLYVKEVGKSRHLYSVNIFSGQNRDLTPIDDAQASVVALSPKHPFQVLISLSHGTAGGDVLYRLDLRTAARVFVNKTPGLTNLLVDDNLEPRVGRRVEAGSAVSFYWKVGHSWRRWLTVPPQDAGSITLLGLGHAGRSVYALDSRNRDTTALVSIDIETSKVSVIAEEKTADIRDVLFDPRSHIPLGYAIARGRLQHKALSQAFSKDIDFLSAQDIGDWTVNSQSADGRYLKMSASNPKRYLAVVYDRRERRLIRLYDVRPHLATMPLVAMHVETIKSRDGLDLTSYLSLPLDADPTESGRPRSPIPLVLAVHGGPHDRDVFGFSPVHQWLANRGYAVLSVNMRGSTGSGKAFMNASKGEWGRELDNDLMDAVEWAIREKIADPAHIAILGGSYGGYAVLTGLTREPDRYACGVDFFGISDYSRLSTLAELSKMSNAINPLYFNEFGDPASPEGQQLMRDQSPLAHADRIKMPLLVIQGAEDKNVDHEQSDLMVSAVKARNVPVTYLLYPDEGHGLQKPNNNLSAYSVADQFLANCLSGRSEPLYADAIDQSSLTVPEGVSYIPGLAAVLKRR